MNTQTAGVWKDQFKEKFCLRRSDGVDITGIVIDYIERYIIMSSSSTFIKATDRLPTKNLPNIFFKHKGNKHCGAFTLFSPSTKPVFYSRISKKDYDDLTNIEWLDESIPTITIQQALEVWDDAQQIGLDLSGFKLDIAIPDKRTYFLSKFEYDINKQ